MTPQMLNGIEIWRLSRPYEDLETMVLKPIFGLVALVLGVPIMLEYDVFRGLVIVLEAGLKFILQDGSVKVLIHPPINLAGISPSHIIHPHTITEPPPNFIVPSTNLSPILFSPCFFHTHFFPSDPNLLILVSSDQTTLFQSSTVQSLCATAKSILSFLCLLLSKGIFFLVTAFRPTVFRHLLMVCAEIGWLVILLRVLAICTAFSALPELIKHERYGQIGFY